MAWGSRKIPKEEDPQLKGWGQALFRVPLLSSRSGGKTRPQLKQGKVRVGMGAEIRPSRCEYDRQLGGTQLNTERTWYR